MNYCDSKTSACRRITEMLNEDAPPEILTWKIWNKTTDTSWYLKLDTAPTESSQQGTVLIKGQCLCHLNKITQDKTDMLECMRVC